VACVLAPEARYADVVSTRVAVVAVERSAGDAGAGRRVVRLQTVAGVPVVAERSVGVAGSRASERQEQGEQRGPADRGGAHACGRTAAVSSRSREIYSDGCEIISRRAPALRRPPDGTIAPRPPSYGSMTGTGGAEASSGPYPPLSDAGVEAFVSLH